MSAEDVFGIFIECIRKEHISPRPAESNRIKDASARDYGPANSPAKPDQYFILTAIFWEKKPIILVRRDAFSDAAIKGNATLAFSICAGSLARSAACWLSL